MPFKLQLSPNNPNTRSHSEQAFEEGGIWDQNRGRRQTRLFAECFHRHVRVPLTHEFTVLDVGCALGDAIPVWRQNYPQARLFGCDVAQTAIDRCQQVYGTIATFFLAGFEDLADTWDVIYCSNVLEHFEQHVEIADALLAHCRILYIMTPYLEFRDGEPLLPELGELHVATLYRDTFNVLERTRQARIVTKVMLCPGAWGGNYRTQAVVFLKQMVKKPSRALNLVKNPFCIFDRQIIYTIYNP